MKLGLGSNRFKLFIVFALLVCAGAPVSAFAADDLAKILARLDAAAGKFKSAQAEITWENVQTEPIPDSDMQVGNVLFERKSGQLRMALHLRTENGKPIQKDMVYAEGVFKLYEPKIKQIQVFKAGSNRAEADTILTLGFGGSGKDLEKSWQVSYVGSEPVDGDETWKLQLIPRDESVRKNFAKVLLWIDTDSGIALKQQSFDPTGNYRVVHYTKMRMNASVPSDAFVIKTASDTRIINH